MFETTITVRGWVGSDVVLSRTPQGVAVASLRVGSTPRRQRDGEWQDGETLWFAVRAWRELGAHVAGSVAKGDPVLVTGRLVAESWQRDDGSRATRHVLVATAVGHDLARGTTVFTRAPRPGAGPAAAAGASPSPGGDVSAGNAGEAA